jgi:hypothetical protein
MPGQLGICRDRQRPELDAPRLYEQGLDWSMQRRAQGII